MTRTGIAIAEALKRIGECNNAKAEEIASSLYNLLLILFDETIRAATGKIAEEEVVERALQRWEDGGR